MSVFALSLPLVLAVPTGAFQEQTLFREMHRMFPDTDVVSQASVLADFDGDGDLDAWIGNRKADCLYLNSGSGVFVVAEGAVPSTSDLTRDLAAGDLDGDGDLDLFAANAKRPTSSPQHDEVYVNDGAGVFTPADGAVPFDGYASTCVELADLDGDGDLDALVGNRAECWLEKGTVVCLDGQGRVYFNDGSGAFDMGPVPPLPADDTEDISIGDVDGDGDLDAWFGMRDFDTLVLNDGTGAFVDAIVHIPIDSYGTAPVELADVDGDGDLDAFLGNDLAGEDRLFLNDGAGFFADATANLPADIDLTHDLALVDVDGDGDVDALLGNDHGDLLYENDGAGTFVGVLGALPFLDEITVEIEVGDVDGDGDVDGLFSGQDLYLNDGGGTFGAFSNVPLHADGPSFLAGGDLDSDGDEDAVLLGKTGLFLLKNQGTGTFTVVASQLPGAPDGGGVALGDVDADGDLDAVTGDCASVQPLPPGSVVLYSNEGGDLSYAPATMPSYDHCTQAIALGDLDQDGDLDVFVGNDGLNVIYTNDGAGFFTYAPSKFPPDLDDTRSVALGDVNGDGSLDALLGIAGGDDRLYLNDGTGAFHSATGVVPSSPDDTYALALVDVDGDADLDAWIAGFTQNHLYLNDGAGVFTDASAGLPPVPQQARALALGDVDGDGDPDAWIVNDGQDRLLRNDGAGVFVDATAALPPDSETAWALLLEDLDGDEDLDALAGYGNVHGLSAVVYSNLSRQVAWRGLARLGKPFELDLHGTPHAGWTLAASLGAAALEVPPFGTLLLDPSGSFVTGSGVLDGEGHATAAFQMPDQPALLGLAVYWQGLLGQPLLFSNLEQSTITAF